MSKLLVALSAWLISFSVYAADGMINVKSPFSVEQTVHRLEQVLADRGMTLFKRVRHSEAGAEVGVDMRKTQLVIFGNPKVGTPLMQCQQTVAIDLPQKALVWEDGNGHVWLSYNDPAYLVKRHDIPGCEAIVGKIKQALAGIARDATLK